MGSPLTGLITDATERDARLLPIGGAALLLVVREDAVDVLAHRLLVPGPGRQALHVGVLGRHHEERRAEQRVGAGGEDRVVDRVGGIDVLAAEHDLRALGATDPVALHRLDVLGPLDRVEIVDQAVRVVRDPEEPLLELPDLDLGTAALALAVDDLLVGEDRGVVGAPVDRRVLAVGQSVLEELQEDPLRPAVVPRLVRPELAGPVDADTPLAELLLEGGDRGRRRVARVLAGADGVVLGREPERVVAHRVQHPLAGTPMEMGDGVADRVDLEVADVGLTRRVREHLQDVALLPVVRLVGDLPGALGLPDLLPAGLDL